MEATEHSKLSTGDEDPHWSRRHSMRAAYWAVLRIYERSVPGDIVEFGTFAGNTAKSLAYGISSAERMHRGRKQGREADTKRDLFLFDSFEGLPNVTSEVDRNHPDVIAGHWGPGKCKMHGPVELLEICGKFLDKNRIHIFPGWFSETIHKLENDQRFSVVYIDCDLYSSTVDVLDGLFSGHHISAGALIYFDDFHCAASFEELGERRAWNEAVEKYQIKFMTGESYAATGQAFLIDNYNALAIEKT